MADVIDYKRKVFVNLKDSIMYTLFAVISGLIFFIPEMLVDVPFLSYLAGKYSEMTLGSFVEVIFFIWFVVLAITHALMIRTNYRLYKIEQEMNISL